MPISVWVELKEETASISPGDTYLGCRVAAVELDPGNRVIGLELKPMEDAS